MLRSFFSYLKEHAEFKQAIKITLAAILSFYLCHALNFLIHHPDNLSNGLWCVVAAIVVLQPYVGGTYKAVINRVLGVLIGSLVGVFFLYFFGGSLTTLAIAIFTTMIISSVLNLKESYRIAGLSVAIVVIPFMMNPEGDPWKFTFFRFLDTCLGILIAVLVSHTIWPSQASVKLRLNIAQILDLLGQLYSSIFLQKNGDKDTQSKKEEDLNVEIKRLLAHSRLILDESKLEKITQSFPLSIWTEIITILDEFIKNSYAIKTVFKDELNNIFDKELHHQVDEVVEGIETSFKYLSARLKDWNGHHQTEDLILISNRLNDQLERFRHTRPTRNYDFAFVERYFVFFYSLKSVLQQLNHLNGLIDLIQEESEDAS